MLPEFQLTETQLGYRMVAGIPDLVPDDLDIYLADGRLALNGGGEFNGTLPVPADVDRDEIEADFTYGVLTIWLPRRKQAVRR